MPRRAGQSLLRRSSPAVLRSSLPIVPIVSKEMELPVNFIRALQLARTCRRCHGRNCCAKMMASCCCLNAAGRLRCSSRPIAPATLLSDLIVSHRLLLVTHSCWECLPRRVKVACHPLLSSALRKNPVLCSIQSETTLSRRTDLFFFPLLWKKVSLLIQLSVGLPWKK